MKFDKLAQTRYSVRRFDPRPVEQKKIDTILETARSAPSAQNKQSWRVLVLQDRSALEKLKECTPCHYNASLAFLVGYDETDDYTRPSDGKHSGEIDASIACTHMMLEATELGVGSTWVMNFNVEKLRQTFFIPNTIHPTALLVCGYPRSDVQINPRHSVRKPIESLCEYNEFPCTAQDQTKIANG